MKKALKLAAMTFICALPLPALAEGCKANRDVSKFMDGRCDWLYGVDTVPPTLIEL